MVFCSGQSACQGLNSAFRRRETAVARFGGLFESSPWVGQPELVEIKLVPAPGAPAQKLSEFTLNLQVKRAAQVDAPKEAPPKAPAGKGGGA